MKLPRRVIYAPRNTRMALQNAHARSGISIRHVRGSPTGQCPGNKPFRSLAGMTESRRVLPKEIQPTTRQSYRQAAQVLGRAFVDDPVSVAVYRNFSPDRRVGARPR